MPEFEVAGLFMQQYLQVLGFSNSFDYADLIARAGQLADEHRDDVRRRFAQVFVDEYQDTDPAQVDLLRSLAGDGRDLTVVGDPDQSHLRLPRRRRARHPRLPGRVPHA